jgi:hypothetical protein
MSAEPTFLNSTSNWRVRVPVARVVIDAFTDSTLTGKAEEAAKVPTIEVADCVEIDFVVQEVDAVDVVVVPLGRFPNVGK